MARSTAHAAGTAATRASREALDLSLARTLADLLGFATLFCWVLLREGFVGSDGATLYNYLPYTAIAQIVALLTLGTWGALRRGAQVPLALVATSGLLGSLGGIAGFASPVPLDDPSLNALSAVILGACQVVLGTFWGMRLSSLGTRSASFALCGAMALAAAVALSCVQAGNGLCAALGLGLPLASAGAAIAGRRLPAPAEAATSAVSVAEPIRHMPHAPKPPALVLLGGAVQASAFFAGVTAFPFALHSVPIMRYWLLMAFAVMALGAVLHACRARVAVQLLMLMTLGILFVGLFLLQSRTVGSVILPLGLMLAGRTCCVGMGWLALVRMAHAQPRHALALLAFGSVGLNGTIGCALGVVANNWLSVSFNDIALGASTVIVAFLVAYLLLEARREAAAASVPPRTPREEPAPPAQAAALAAEAFLDAIGLTPDERELAALICEQATYEAIAQASGASLRTVKYQADTLFRKAHVANRRAFEQLMRRLDA